MLLILFKTLFLSLYICMCMRKGKIKMWYFLYEQFKLMRPLTSPVQCSFVVIASSKSGADVNGSAVEIINTGVFTNFTRNC